MRTIEYIRAESIGQACSLLSEYGVGAAVLAGGTDLLIGLRRLVPGRKVLIDISQVGELGGVTEANGIISLKPLATHADLLRSEVLLQGAPLLAAAAASIGSPQIRARGTVGGNIMNAAACADTVPPLIALDARVTLHSQKGTRTLKLSELFLKPYQTQAQPEELLTQIEFPKVRPGARGAFIKLGRRNALAISRLSVAAVLEVGPDGSIVDARLVAGAAFPVWRRVTAAEQMLLGEKPSAKLFTAAGEKMSAEMVRETGRRWSTEYKEPVLAVLVRRALEACTVSGAQPVATPRVQSRTRACHLAAVPACGTSVPAQTATITTTVNGRSYTLTVPANQTLLEFLREHLGLTGTKCGCEIGECGACTVLLDGEPVNSCLVLAAQVHGRQLSTVEGLMQHGKLHPLQAAFLDHDAVQCGFCTPGMLMSAKALLDYNPRATEQEARTAISGNLCRCTGYQPIVAAIRAVSA